MEKDILYIGGGFDVLHGDHKKFIVSCIKLFFKKYWNLQKLIIGLKPDSRLNTMKWVNRPIFSYEWRSEDISNFLSRLSIPHSIVVSTDFLEKYKGKNNVVVGISSEYYPKGGKQFEIAWFSTLYVNSKDLLHTSLLEEKLLNVQEKSNCKLRKVGALLIREGRIISEGHSGSGNCDSCHKYIAYKKGGGKLSQNIECDYPHAEIVALKKVRKWDDILISNSPCQKCAELIVRKWIRRVVYMKEYYNIQPIVFLKDNWVDVRRAWITS